MQRLRTTDASSDLKYGLLLDISQQISRSIDLQEVLDHLLQSLRAVVDYDAAGIFVLNRNVPFGPGPMTNLIVGMAAVGFPLERNADTRRLKSKSRRSACSCILYVYSRQ